MLPVRSPAVAGQFYPESREQCRSQIEQCLAEAERFESAAAGLGGTGTAEGETPRSRFGLSGLGLVPGFEPLGGIVPHAGWVCSGAVAGQVIRILGAAAGVETFVVFGAAHQRITSGAAVYDRGAWETPLGEMLVDEELATKVVEAGSLAPADPGVHEYEHSIEVEVPFIQFVAPSAKLLPIIVAPSMAAAEVGRIVARAAAELGRRVVFLGSSDLTHYGPRYRFVPQGVGPEGVRWAKEVNDQHILDLVAGLRSDEVVREAAEHRNACGAGAIAATLAAAQVAGATAGYVLRHTNSNEVLCSRYGEMDDAVGYAGVVLGRSGT